MDMMKNITKSDLKDGMVVEVRCGYTYQTYRNVEKALGVFGSKGRISMRSHEDDLTCIHNHDFDIVAVFLLTHDVYNLCESEELKNCKCIWRREESKVLEERIAAVEEKMATLTKNFANIESEVKASFNAILTKLREIRVRSKDNE